MRIKGKCRHLLLLLAGLFSLGALSESRSPRGQSDDGPVVLGHGKALFKVGALIERDDFESLENWVVQVQERSGFASGKIEVQDGGLNCYLPGRGATIWFRRKLPGRVAITYDVVCPTAKIPVNGLEPRDINNFWMASDPLDPDAGLFDSERYTGAFGTYDKLRGYYASTGGGRNTTTRMRRYPREADGQPVPHIALKDKDGKPGFLITPDKVMTVQLVAFDDVVQYIVDGRLIYEMKGGDEVQVERVNEDGERVSFDAVYTVDRFPIYNEGYFGFRMVGTHHVYSKFKVHALVPR